MLRFLIIGGGLAGVSAAVQLREEGFDGAITIVGEESDQPYDRPPCSKEYLRGDKPFEKILLKPEGFYADNTITTILGSPVTRIDLEGKVVETKTKEQIPYDSLLIATGSRNRKLQVPGSNLEGIWDLRTVADANKIRTEISAGRTAVLVGMGFIGCEVAAALTQAGVKVTILEALAVPFQHVLGREVGQSIEHLHLSNGALVRTNESLAGFEGTYRVQSVSTTAGENIECDFAIVGVGAQPNVELAAAAGLDVDNGIMVDAFCRTSAPDVFAAGDVTRHFHPVAGQSIRVEHWQNALKQGQAAARNMLGIPSEYAEVHWFWSDHYDCNIQYAGFHGPWDELVVRGSVEERKFVGFYLNQGAVSAAVAMNNGRDLRRAKELVRAGATIDPDALRNPDLDLRKLVG